MTRWARDLKKCARFKKKKCSKRHQYKLHSTLSTTLSKISKATTKGIDYKEAYILVNKVIDEISSQVDDIYKRHLGLEDNTISASPSIPYISESMMRGDQNFQNVKGIQKRGRMRRGKCPKV